MSDNFVCDYCVWCKDVSFDDRCKRGPGPVDIMTHMMRAAVPCPAFLAHSRCRRVTPHGVTRGHRHELAGAAAVGVGCRCCWTSSRCGWSRGEVCSDTGRSGALFAASGTADGGGEAGVPTHIAIRATRLPLAQPLRPAAYTSGRRAAPPDQVAALARAAAGVAYYKVNHRPSLRPAAPRTMRLAQPRRRRRRRACWWQMTTWCASAWRACRCFAGAWELVWRAW